MKDVQDLYTENYKTLSRDTEEGLNKWRDIPCPLKGSILLRCHFSPKYL